MAIRTETLYSWASQLDRRLIVAAGLSYVIAVAIYRLYFSPIAHIPGPKIAALTTWYAGYHDLIRGGQYVKVIAEMHKKYGPIVRIRPDSLHINDHNFVGTLYSQDPRHRRERYETNLKSFQAPYSILGTQDHDLHRSRRAVLSPYFSQQSVRGLSNVVNKTMLNLLRRMDGWAAAGQPIQMNLPLRAATKDVIQSYALGGGTTPCLDIEDCNAAFFDMMIPGRVSHLGPHMYWLAKLLYLIPPSIMRIMNPRMGSFVEFISWIYAQIKQVKHSQNPPPTTKDSSRSSIFHEILASSIPESEKSDARIAQEAGILLIAGTDTLAATLAAIMYEVLADRNLLNRLRDELKAVIPEADTAIDPAKLDKLPLLNAIIQEGLRMHPGVVLRQDRVCPDETLVYTYPDDSKRQITIPRGTAMGMTAPLLNRCPEIYGNDPDVFRPQRYIDDPGLQKYLFSFGKGGRQCIGINLAWEEMKVFVAGVFRKYDLYDEARAGKQGPTLELYETSREDVAMYADFVTPGFVPGSQGMRVRIRR
ncbi:Trichodiene oxygenase [Cyphellophora attinorum]|uniref:Trichodiene oxygenase n=1 Tax=Cyphellophora attinorum TaxID=1664694 RepID=A0A0N1NXP3_9EURO|nr:Trichodiene oxygenase [Phialophora attinorum]KPI35302.1 Trichodiene oxygenase [Phialophora attinorum]